MAFLACRAARHHAGVSLHNGGTLVVGCREGVHNVGQAGITLDTLCITDGRLAALLPTVSAFCRSP